MVAVALLLWAGSDGAEFTAAARAYADFMIPEGRRWNSRLFAGALIKGAQPALPPDAVYGDAAKKQDPRIVMNLPNIYRSGNMAHKITWRGADLADDVGLLRLLYSLSKSTGDERYGQAADDAIRWFLAHAIVPETGLPAWGEHSGWDFRRQRPDRTDPPYQHHEFDGDWPFYDKFVALQPQPAPGAPTVLERWARALWEGAVFRKDGRMLYCRHAALFVRGRPDGGEYLQYGMFPRHGGLYAKHWAIALGASKNREFIEWMRPRLEQFVSLIEEQIATTGYPIYEEKGRQTFMPDQIAGMASSFEEAAAHVPALAARLRALASACDHALASRGAPLAAEEAWLRLQAHPSGPYAAYFRRRFDEHAERLASMHDLPPRELADKGKSVNLPGRIPAQYAEAIDTLLRAEHPEAARRLALQALNRFQPDPLPASLDRPAKTPEGEVFPPFYHSYLGGDDLMYSLWSLGERITATPSAPRPRARPGSARERP